MDHKPTYDEVIIRLKERAAIPSNERQYLSLYCAIRMRPFEGPNIESCLLRADECLRKIKSSQHNPCFLGDLYRDHRDIQNVDSIIDAMIETVYERNRAYFSS